MAVVTAGRKRLHQAVEGLLPGDATSAHVLLLQRWLRELGFESDIYFALNTSGETEGVKPFVLSALAGEDLVIFHHTMGSEILAQLSEARVPLVLIYHNITPPQFFGGLDIMVVRQLMRGRTQMQQLPAQTRLALSDSPYSELELQELGFRPTGVLPIVLDQSHYEIPVDEALYAECKKGGPLLLFVGRITPNKRQEDLVELLFYYRRVQPEARLVLVGHPEEKYLIWLKRLVDRLGLSDAVMFTGRVSQQEMVTYYRAADVFVSMSEHEGFGKPLIESMYFDLPVLAYASTAVPSTLGGAGVLFKRKDYEALAELLDLMIYDDKLRSSLIAGQRARVRAFLEPQVREQWLAYLETLGLLTNDQPGAGARKSDG
jgi:glycosyltransferase involved in cell wall biosynthesis